jgi:hypothetical protein
MNPGISGRTALWIRLTITLHKTHAGEKVYLKLNENFRYFAEFPMNDDYFKEQAARVRNIASFADPFTKKRLLALAERYDSKKSSSRQTPLPNVSPTP